MVKDIKELDKLLKLLRKQGVTEFAAGGLSLKLGELPSKLAVAQAEAEEGPSMPSDEELMFYHVNQGQPQGPTEQ